jgi:hypothetical protein
VKLLTATSVAVAVLAAAAIAFVMLHRPEAGADPFAGAYPLVTPSPTVSPAPTWQPTGPPAGPLPTFHGRTSPVSGRIRDRKSGISYVRFAQPWHGPGVFSGFHTAGQELDSKRRDAKHFWYASVYSGPLPKQFDVPGPNRLRAGAELAGRDMVSFIFPDNAVRKEIAGAPTRVAGLPAWVSAFRIFHPPGSNNVERSRTVAVVTIQNASASSGVSVIELSVPSNQNRLLPDINLAIRSVRIFK